MARRQLHALRRNEVDERIMRGRGGQMHSVHHALIGLRAGDREHVWILRANLVRLRAHAAGDDDFSVFTERRANRLQRFALGRIQKAAGVHDHCVGPVMALGQLISFRPQAGEDALGIDQSLRAAEGDEGNTGGGAGRLI